MRGPSQKGSNIIHELLIKLLRESVDLVEVALGVFPNGLADYKRFRRNVRHSRIRRARAGIPGDRRRQGGV